jgi:hypothetical protein
MVAKTAHWTDSIKKGEMWYAGTIAGYSPPDTNNENIRTGV